MSSATIEATLSALGAPARVTTVHQGPTFARYALNPAPNVRVARLLRLHDDLAVRLGVPSVRMEPEADGVALEVPRPDPQTVLWADIMREASWPASPCAFVLGRDVMGRPHVADLARMPHLLIAGTTGSGKSVLLNALLASMVVRSGPQRLRLLLIDVKRVELSPYASLPHLVSPLVTEPEDAADALSGVVATMERRYAAMVRSGERTISNHHPRIVVIVDELADLVMTSKPASAGIIRLAQKGRAAGIHLVLATQRPSTDVISGLLKANVPGRIAFAVPSNIDSRVILDRAGAEDLLGRGDMLFLAPWASEPIRIQGAWITDDEVRAVVGMHQPPPAPVVTPVAAPTAPAVWAPTWVLVLAFIITLVAVATVWGR